MYVQNCVVDKIRDAFPHLSWIADKKVQDGCSKRRSDFKEKRKTMKSSHWYLGTSILILER